MPCSYEIDSARGLVLVRLAGKFTYADVSALSETLKNDPRFDPSFSELVDVTESESAGMPVDRLRELAQHSIYSPQSRRAVLVKRELNFGLARVYGAYLEINGAAGVNVFRDRDEAMRWLGLA
ncbi:MAG TPA: hypothetical protein VFT72_09940 [Opitutaceae bacterium]|nr:hypothetical protein [Opitutaceae bacterium]